ncbi:unnamed protein product [Orchesella dallaii]|uniref:Uncharacterized protein n=1 Tax=Orchesella dallaii TaxID=48710 RepID=A0ABP1RRS4_9HEXA
MRMSSVSRSSLVVDPTAFLEKSKEVEDLQMSVSVEKEARNKLKEDVDNLKRKKKGASGGGQAKGTKGKAGNYKQFTKTHFVNEHGTAGSSGRNH